jgi:hypothetical protein
MFPFLKNDNQKFYLSKLRKHIPPFRLIKANSITKEKRYYWNKDCINDKELMICTAKNSIKSVKETKEKFLK